MRLARGQREERGDRVGIPVDVEREARLADALDQRQRRRRAAPARPAAASRSAARACRAARRAARAAPRRSPARTAATAARRAPPRRPRARPASSPEIVSSTNAPRPFSRAAPTRPTQPLVASASHAVTVRRDEQRRVALDHALDVRRGGVGLRRPPLLRVPVEAAAGDRAHGVDDVGAVGEREHDVLVPVAVGAELDVVSGLHETHGTVHGTAPLGCHDHVARQRRRRDHPGRRGA